MVPLALALTVLALVIPLAWMGATPVTSACDEAIARTGELGDVDSHASFWPPGVRCVSHVANGTVFEETYFTWYELTIAVLCGLAVWLVSAATLRVVAVRQFLFGLTGAIVVFTLASIGFFL